MSFRATAARGGLLLAALVALQTAAWRPAAGQPAAPDSLTPYLRGLADSTDVYFGESGAPPDTAGLDSVLAERLARPERRRLYLRPRIGPDFTFNRVDGPVYGGRVAIGRERAWGELRGEASYAVGPNDWLGGGGFERRFGDGERYWGLDVWAGRATATIDRERGGRRLAALRALLFGGDRRHYYRRDGILVGLSRQTPTFHAGIGYRDMLESPLAVTTGWSLLDKSPTVTPNLQAALGRAREMEVSLAWRLPRVPITVEGVHHGAGRAFNSDFTYGRYRLAASGDFGLGRFLSAVPQVAYGRLIDTFIPQEALYLGGSKTMRSLPSSGRGGSRMALARLDLIGTQDVLALARIPHPAALPIQLGTFLAAGAVWGPDPFGGPARSGDAWPDPEHWISETGVVIIYQPGIPEPTTMVRLSFAWALGPKREDDKWSISIASPFDVLRVFERERP